MMIEELRERFGQSDHVTFVAGGNGLPLVRLHHPNGSTAEVYLNGAQVTSWRHHVAGEVLFMSSAVEYLPGKSFRGGIPVIFPQFGPGVLPSHGFARTLPWGVTRAGLLSTGEVAATLTLRDTAETRALWPHHFQLELSVFLAESLTTSLVVTNFDPQPIEFTAAFHTYFRVGDITRTTIAGLEGLHYLDKVREGLPGVEDRPTITVDQFTDRMYLHAPDELVIADDVLKRTIVIQKRELQDAVLWNPWHDRTPAFRDLGADDWRRFVCLEAGTVGNRIQVAPGQSFSGSQTIRSVPW